LSEEDQALVQLYELYFQKQRLTEARVEEADERGTMERQLRKQPVEGSNPEVEEQQIPELFMDKEGDEQGFRLCTLDQFLLCDAKGRPVGIDVLDKEGENTEIHAFGTVVQPSAKVYRTVRQRLISSNQPVSLFHNSLILGPCNHPVESPPREQESRHAEEGGQA
jgi:hypothetical protein